MTSPRHSSETNEHYTPADIVEASRLALGGIDLDPASCEVANRVVKASRIFTRETNGYGRPWDGRVFLNPPGGWCDKIGQLVIKASGDRPACTVSGTCGLPPGHRHEGAYSSQGRWWAKLAREYAEGHVSAAIFVSFSVELLQSSQVDEDGLTPHLHPIWFPSRRIAYMKPDGTKGGSPPHSSMIVFLGRDVDAFVHAFDAGHLSGAFVGPLRGVVS